MSAMFSAMVSDACELGDCGCCASPDCRDGCHVDQAYVPLMGWMPSARAALERKTYLDADQAIAQRMDQEGDRWPAN